jgi:hypothetical protein
LKINLAVRRENLEPASVCFESPVKAPKNIIQTKGVDSGYFTIVLIAHATVNPKALIDLVDSRIRVCNAAYTPCRTANAFR